MSLPKIVFFPVLLGGLTACASLLEPDWDPPPGKTLADFNKDAMACQYEWSQLTPLSDTPYPLPEADGLLGFFTMNGTMDLSFESDCLEKKGWRRKK